MSADHSIVTLDATEDDLLDARGVTEEIKRLRDILFSDAAAAMDENLRQKVMDYITTKSRTVAQQNIMDAININTKGVAQDVLRKLDVDQRKTEIEHLLGTVVEPAASSQMVVVESQSAPLVIVDDDNDKEEEEEKRKGDRHARKAQLV